MTSSSRPTAPLSVSRLVNRDRARLGKCVALTHALTRLWLNDFPTRSAGHIHPARHEPGRSGFHRARVPGDRGRRGTTVLPRARAEGLLELEPITREPATRAATCTSQRSSSSARSPDSMATVSTAICVHRAHVCCISAPRLDVPSPLYCRDAGKRFSGTQPVGRGSATTQPPTAGSLGVARTLRMRSHTCVSLGGSLSGRYSPLLVRSPRGGHIG